MAAPLSLIHISPEPTTMKLYMPLTADFYERDEWGDMSEDSEELGIDFLL